MTTHRTRMDEAITAHHHATAKTAALGGMLAKFLSDGMPVESLGIIIDHTIAATHEAATTLQAVRDEGERSRERYAPLLARLEQALGGKGKQ